MIFCVDQRKRGGVGETPELAYENYKLSFRYDEESPKSLNGCSFFEGEQIKVEYRDVPVLQKQLVKVS